MKDFEERLLALEERLASFGQELGALRRDWAAGEAVDEEEKKLQEETEALKKELVVDRAATEGAAVVTHESEGDEQRAVMAGETPDVLPELSEPDAAAEGRSESEALFPEEDKEGLEMAIGRVWFVRLGIVLLLSGVVLFSQYVYANWVLELSNGARLALLVTFSAILTSVGLFLERGREALQNYGRVVAAGGLSCLYFAAYGARFVGPLQVTTSEVLAGLLMTLAAGLMMGVAHWRQARLLAGFGLGLAFYSVALVPVGVPGTVTLLVLVIGAQVLFWKNRGQWEELLWIALLGSVLVVVWSYGTESVAAFQHRWLVTGIWAAFLPTVFGRSNFGQEELAQDAVSSEQAAARRLLFVGLLHGLTVLLLSVRFSPWGWASDRWVVAAVSGVVLATLALIPLALERLRNPGLQSLHGGKALTLLTLALMLKLEGNVLFLTLLFEAVVLVLAAKRLPVLWWLIWAARIVASVSGIVMLLTWEQFGITEGVGLWAVSLWVAYATAERWRQKWPEHLVIESVAAVAVALLLLFGVVFKTWAIFPQTLVAVGLLVAGSGLVGWKRTRWRMTELSGWGIVAGFYFAADFLATVQVSEWEMVSIPLAFAVAATIWSHWDALEGTVIERAATYVFALVSMGAAAVLITQSRWEAGSQLLVLQALGVATVGVGWLTRDRWHFLLSLLPLVVTLGLGASVVGASGWAVLLSMAYLGALYFGMREVAWRDALRVGALAYAAGILFIYLVATVQSFALVWIEAAVLIAVAQWFRWRAAEVFSFIIAFFISIVTLFALSDQESWEMLFGALVLLAVYVAQARFGRRTSPWVPWLALPVMAMAWHRTGTAPGVTVTAAVFGAVALALGLWGKARALRLTAFSFLVVALGRLAFVDLIALDPLPRIFAFMTLGAGLLGLGYIYNRYSEELKGVL